MTKAHERPKIIGGKGVELRMSPPINGCLPHWVIGKLLVNRLSSCAHATVKILPKES